VETHVPVGAAHPGGRAGGEAAALVHRRQHRRAEVPLHRRAHPIRHVRPFQTVAGRQREGFRAGGFSHAPMVPGGDPLSNAISSLAALDIDVRQY
jgi:hypothetical protein